jgi:hypothetical protein
MNHQPFSKFLKLSLVHNLNSLIVLEMLIEHQSKTCLNYILWQVDPLLGKDREIDCCSAAVAKQYSVNKKRRMVFSAWSAKQ